LEPTCLSRNGWATFAVGPGPRIRTFPPSGFRIFRGAIRRGRSPDRFIRHPTRQNGSFSEFRMFARFSGDHPFRPELGLLSPKRISLRNGMDAELPTKLGLPPNPKAARRGERWIYLPPWRSSGAGNGPSISGRGVSDKGKGQKKKAAGEGNRKKAPRGAVKKGGVQVKPRGFHGPFACKVRDKTCPGWIFFRFFFRKFSNTQGPGWCLLPPTTFGGLFRFEREKTDYQSSKPGNAGGWGAWGRERFLEPSARAHLSVRGAKPGRFFFCHARAVGKVATPL